MRAHNWHVPGKTEKTEKADNTKFGLREVSSNGIYKLMGTDARQFDLHKLRVKAEHALRKATTPQQQLRVLRRLLPLFPPDGKDALFIHQRIAALCLESEPWQAALAARRAVRLAPGDDYGWALYALALTLLNQYHAAANAYFQALRIAPWNPWYANNLGHLLDVGLNCPERGLPLLAMAHERQPDDLEIATSYAQALERAGQEQKAQDVLRRVMGKQLETLEKDAELVHIVHMEDSADTANIADNSDVADTTKLAEIEDVASAAQRRVTSSPPPSGRGQVLSLNSTKNATVTPAVKPML